MSDPMLRILVLDDEAPIVSALVSTLRENGFHVVGATTPTEALARLRAQRFDVLLTDLNLPEMDGIAVVRAARSADPAIIPIVMTGHGSIDTAVDALKAGAVDYLLKPFKMRTVQAVMSRAVAERNLRYHNESLQRQLAARSHELEALNKELEAFSYSISHDLRAPLRAIGGFAQVLLEEVNGGNPADLRDYAQRIQRSAVRMTGMVDDLLRMGQASQRAVEIQPVDLSESCREFVRKCRTAQPERRVDWTVPHTMPVDADPGLIAIVMENLLANAWKYTARQEIGRIEIKYERSEVESVIGVSDNGVGFDMAESKRLFAPFTRLGTAAGFDGTGVGLATVQRVVHRHGGRIWAEAAPGQGAHFTFTLPNLAANSKPETLSPA
jgi:signal transduction histidine kinase